MTPRKSKTKRINISTGAMRQQLFTCFLVHCCCAFVQRFPPFQSYSTLMSVKIGSGIEEVAKEHNVFLLDMWGVMHDGSNPYAGVVETIRKLKEAGKEMIILSNSSKRQGNSIKMLSTLGFDPSDFSQVITSGEVSCSALILRLANQDPFNLTRVMSREHRFRIECLLEMTHWNALVGQS